MTIEEKARAYDEALDRCKEWASGTWGHSVDDSPKDIAEFIFPQLAESEDERIRRALIDGVRQIRCKNGVTQEQMLAYLEKQKEPENISASTMIPSFHEELTEFELVLFNAVLDNNFVGAKGSENALAMTKKVAPELLAIAKKEPNWDKEKCFVCQEYEKGFKQGHLEGCTAGYNKAMKEVNEQKEPHFTKRNALFDKCVENCDPEVMKKVSDEIDEMLQKEQKEINFVEELKHYLATTPREQLEKEWKEIESFGSFGPTVREYLYGEQKPNYCHYGGDPSVERCKYCSATCSARLTEEQKPAEWSEEDKLHYANVLEALEYVKGCKSDYDKIEAVKSDIDWLKSLRPSWKPTDDEERLINTSISFLKDFADKGYENAVECIDWLKSKLNGDTGK